jgi:hypothetical protein
MDIAMDLELPADYLMACIAFESGKSFRPDKKNLAGSGAIGLIQFMPSTAKRLGTSTQALSKMTPEQQLTYVHKYFIPYRGRLKTLEDVYMAILWPRAIGKEENYVLFNSTDHPTTYKQNAGLDLDKDGNITKWEASQKVRDMLIQGLEEKEVWIW